ncbi:hypothetical protein Tco_0649931 [Tanacetum coccineum]
MHESKSFNKHPTNKTLYHALMESLIADENAMDQGVADLLKHKKRSHDDDDRDQDPPVGPDKRVEEKEDNQGCRTAQKAKHGETVFEAADTDMPFNQGDDMGETNEQPDVEAALKADCKPLPLHESRCLLTVPVDFFFNNDLEYLRGGSTDRKYTTSTTKTKAVKVSRHDVYSTIRILSVTSVTVDEWYGYGYLKEIIVRRAYKKLYKFIKGDFPRLHLNDIEDMLLLVA